ncbi:MAG: hypothetical protein ACK5II_05345 [Paracoccus sp. (in: a-proteobacteria)]
MPMLAPGEKRSYDFDPLPGTHWMRDPLAGDQPACRAVDSAHP